jgi:hypothetical protein
MKQKYKLAQSQETLRSWKKRVSKETRFFMPEIP